MNARPSDSERVLRSWFLDGPTAMPDRLIDGVAARIAREPQRSRWRLRGRLRMTTPIKLAAGLAAVVVVAVAAWQLLPGNGGVGGPASPSPTVQPTVEPSPTAVPLADGPLEAGRYRFDLSFVEPGLSVAADIPAGWRGHTDAVAATSPDGENLGILFTFMEVDGLFSDPCQWDLDGTGMPDRGDVEVGPSVNDLVAAITANTSYTSSTPSAVAFGSFEGQQLELQLPGDDVIRDCDRREGQSTGDYFVFPGGFYAQSSNSRWQLTIVDVEGTRLITLVSIAEGTPQADITAAEAIVDSLEFIP